ncbi:hypothetical protein CF319_g6774 [Tilletia indica]|nr:hypothetical protein CF319_g6774 [Tilletia indica]
MVARKKTAAAAKSPLQSTPAQTPGTTPQRQDDSAGGSAQQQQQQHLPPPPPQQKFQEQHQQQQHLLPLQHQQQAPYDLYSTIDAFKSAARRVLICSKPFHSDFRFVESLLSMPDVGVLVQRELT